MIAIRGMQGLGDNVYQRAFIKSLVKSKEVLLETPWPEIYEDLPNIKFIKPQTKLRTQKKSLEKVDTMLGTYSTKFDSSVSGRSHNVALAAKSTSDVILMPGESFSYNEHTGTRTISNGYKIII